MQSKNQSQFFHKLKRSDFIRCTLPKISLKACTENIFSLSIFCLCFRLKKVFFQFQFVNSFLALFYTAFYLQDMDKLKEVKNNMFEVLNCALILQDFWPELKNQPEWTYRFRFILAAVSGSVDHKASGGKPQGVHIAVRH